MKAIIVKDGTKIILFATGVITGHWSTMDDHYKELDGTEGDLDNLMRKDFEVLNTTHPSGKVARVSLKKVH